MVATIVVKYLRPKGIGIVFWSWTDNRSQLYPNNLKDLIYFTNSPVNILSKTGLDNSMKDDKGTWSLTKIKDSAFTWDFKNYSKTISHSEVLFYNYKYKPDLSIL